jgi:hypothetical protein
MLKRDYSTIDRWLKTYFQGGITELLTVKKAPGETPQVPPFVRKKSIKKLQQRGRQVRANYSYGYKKKAGLK